MSGFEIAVLCFIGYIIIAFVVNVIRLEKRGSGLDPVNYEYRFSSNQKKVKIELKIPSLFIPFRYYWEDYQVADTWQEAIHCIYHTKYFDSVEEAEEHIKRLRQRKLQTKIDNHFTPID
jgi:hypothetical protein